jgi:hypothetical protein
VAWDWIHEPNFPTLRDTPRVSGWYHAHRPAFREEWLRENEPFLIRMDSAVYDVGVNRLVREWERGTGRTFRSCILEVYFVRDLGTYQREV